MEWGRTHPRAVLSCLLLISAIPENCAEVMWPGGGSNRTKSLAALPGIVDRQDLPGSSGELLLGSLTLPSTHAGPLSLMLRNTALRPQHRKSPLCTPNRSNSRNGQDLPSTHPGNEQLLGRVLSSSLAVSSLCPSALCPLLFGSVNTQQRYKKSAFSGGPVWLSH